MNLIDHNNRTCSDAIVTRPLVTILLRLVYVQLNQHGIHFNSSLILMDESM